MKLVMCANQEDYTCPICAEQMDESDLSLYPCKCDYQICRWCLQKIIDSGNQFCPNCRTLYEESNYRHVSVKPVLRTNNKKTLDSKNVMNLSDSNIKQYISDENRNKKYTDKSAIITAKKQCICRLYNLPQSWLDANELAGTKFFGKYGGLQNILISNYKNMDVVFLIFQDEEAAKLVELDLTKFLNSLNCSQNSSLASIKLVFGSARNCIYSLKNMQCPHEKCNFIHRQFNYSSDLFWKYETKKEPILGIEKIIQDPTKESLFTLSSDAVNKVSKYGSRAAKVVSPMFSQPTETYAVTNPTPNPWKKSSSDRINNSISAYNSSFPTIDELVDVKTNQQNTTTVNNNGNKKNKESNKKVNDEKFDEQSHEKAMNDEKTNKDSNNEYTETDMKLNANIMNSSSQKSTYYQNSLQMLLSELKNNEANTNKDIDNFAEAQFNENKNEINSNNIYYGDRYDNDIPPGFINVDLPRTKQNVNDYDYTPIIDKPNMYEKHVNKNNLLDNESHKQNHEIEYFQSNYNSMFNAQNNLIDKIYYHDSVVINTSVDLSLLDDDFFYWHLEDNEQNTNEIENNRFHNKINEELINIILANTNYVRQYNLSVYANIIKNFLSDAIQSNNKSEICV